MVVPLSLVAGIVLFLFAILVSLPLLFSLPGYYLLLFGLLSVSIFLMVWGVRYGSRQAVDAASPPDPTYVRPVYCADCGQANPIESTYCNACGHRIQRPVAAQPPPDRPPVR